MSFVTASYVTPAPSDKLTYAFFTPISLSPANAFTIPLTVYCFAESNVVDTLSSVTICSRTGSPAAAACSCTDSMIIPAAMAKISKKASIRSLPVRFPFILLNSSSVCISIVYFSIRNIPYLWSASFCICSNVEAGFSGLNSCVSIPKVPFPGFLNPPVFPIFPDFSGDPVSILPTALLREPVGAFFSSRLLTVFLTERPVLALNRFHISNLKKRITLIIKKTMHKPRHT